MSIVKEKREDIIRTLDVLNIGPYLVRNGVLSQQKYTEEFSSLIEDGRAVNDELTPKLFEEILNKPAKFCKALDESVNETHHKGHQELLIILQQNVKKAKKIKKGLMTRAAHKVKKTFKPKQKLLSVDKRSASPYGEYSDPEHSDDEVSMVSQDYALDPQGSKPWYDSLSASPSGTSLTSTSTPNIVVNDDKNISKSSGNVSDSNSDKPDRNEIHDTKLSFNGRYVSGNSGDKEENPDHDEIHDAKSSPKNHKTELSAKTKTESKSDSIFSLTKFSGSKQKVDTERLQLENENRTLKEQLLSLRVEIKKNELLLKQQREAANSREAELQKKMDEMKAEHDTVCAEMGTKNAELILKLESLQEMYTNEFHGTVHVKQLQVRLEAERQKVKRLEKEKNLAFGKQDLYKINEQLTKELSQAKAEISYLRHMVPKKCLRSQDNDGNPVNDD